MPDDGRRYAVRGACDRRLSSAAIAHPAARVTLRSFLWVYGNDLQRVAHWIGLPARFVAGISGHSTRVGAVQDLAELDIDLAAIRQAGMEVASRCNTRKR